MEPITPELVLVDPELRARVLGRGPVSDCLAPRPRTPAPPAVLSVSAPRRYRARRPLAGARNVALAVSLLVNAVLLGAAWTGRGSGTVRTPTLAKLGTTPTIGAAALKPVACSASGFRLNAGAAPPRAAAAPLAGSCP